jgi:hypothetical protein
MEWTEEEPRAQVQQDHGRKGSPFPRHETKGRIQKYDQERSGTVAEEGRSAFLMSSLLNMKQGPY